MIRSKTQTRRLNSSKGSQKELPRINSQNRIKTAHERKQSMQALKLRPQSNNKDIKRTMSTSGACKTVRCEATSALYASKIKQAQKQNLLLDTELKKIQDQINDLRKSTMQNKRTQQFVQAQVLNLQNQQQTNDQQNKTQLKYRKNININDAKTIKNQIKMMENRIGIIRKKIDQQTEKNNTSRNRIDAIRREIKTFKGLNSTLEVSYKKTQEEFDLVMEMSKRLEDEISEKNLLMNKIRVENLHRKGQIIKQYDNILRHLDKELNNTNKKSRVQQTENSRGQNFYMTEVSQLQAPPPKATVNKIPSSPKKRQSALHNQLAIVQENLQILQNQFEYLKQHKGTKNVQQLTKNHQNKYEQNFKYYKFINSELTKNLQEAQAENQQAKQRREQIIEELNNKHSEIRIEEINQIEANIQYTRSQKAKISQKYQQYQEFYEGLTSLVKEICRKIHMKEIQEMFDQGESVTEDNMVKILQIIKEKFFELRESDEEHESDHKYHSYHQQTNLQQILENAKKQGNTQRLLCREDFLKTITSNANTTNNSTKRNKSSSRSGFLKK